MAAAFGIHFGSTSACLAVCKDGKTDVIANDTGDRTTPAVVSYTDHDKAVGLAAKQGMIRNAANSICNVKQYLGKEFNEPEVQELIGKSSAKVVNKDGQPVFEPMYKEKPIKVTPVEIVTAIYKKMMDTAESHGGIADSHDAVISVPLHFTDKQKKAISTAASNAGFRVLRTISEPAAAVLAYDIGQNKHSVSNINVLVYRLGGTSVDTTIVTVCNGMYRIVGSSQDKAIGGHMIDEIIMDYFAAEFKKQWKYDCKENKRSVMKLRSASENCKHILSRMQTAQCSVESLYEGIDFQSTLSRGRLEAISSSFLQKCISCVQTTLDKARFHKDDIHKVIICGGMTNMPSLQQQLRDFFPQAELLSSLPPEEVIAAGASKQASIISGMDEAILTRNSKETSVSCLPVDLLIKLSDEESGYVTVMEKFTPAPAKRQQDIQLGDEQDSICVLVYCRQSPTDQPRQLAKIALRDIPNGSRVNAVFSMKGDGSLSITCSEPTTTKSAHVVIES